MLMGKSLPAYAKSATAGLFSETARLPAGKMVSAPEKRGSFGESSDVALWGRRGTLAAHCRC
jgi:hypothetical protein